MKSKNMREKVRHYVKACVITYVIFIMTSKIRLDVKEYGKYGIISKRTLQRQKVHHNLKKYVKVCHDVKKYIMT